METLASIWACDPRDLGDGQKPSSVLEPRCDFSRAPSAGRMWAEQLSPHLQRNKQLQDALLQREEELARLQEENRKLRGFLDSSYVKHLEEKAKRLADGRRRLKRNPMRGDGGSLPVSKRLCRNLTAEFCSESSSSSSSEPNLDLWVLQTLGLKDRDTIDTSDASSSSPRYRLSVAIASSGDSSLDAPSAAASSLSSVHSDGQTDHRRCAAKRQEPGCGKTAQNFRMSPGQRLHFAATGPTRHHEAPEAPIRNYNPLTALRSPPQTHQRDPVQTRGGNPVHRPAHWSPISLEPSVDRIRFSPPAERSLLSPLMSQSPVTNRPTPASGPSAGRRPPATPRTPGGRTDLAFSMSLSPSSSVKTHSFPHGQAFVRKDPEGKWNFTWVPRQGP